MSGVSSKPRRAFDRHSLMSHHESLPLAQIAKTLKVITEQLAQELGRSSVAGPQWNDTELRIAQVVASMHGVSSLLAAKSRRTEPASWIEFLQRQRLHTAHHHANVVALLASIDERARSLSIPVVGLKGAALYAMSLYSPGERPMADVDLLVHEADREAVIMMLKELGYDACGVTSKHWMFARPVSHAPAALGEYENNPVKIDLHTRIMEPLPHRVVDISTLIFPRKAQAGLNAYPSLHALMSHLLLHAAGAICLRGLRLLHLHDIALLAQRLQEVDWARIVQAHGTWDAWWAYPPLHLTERYFPGTIPPNVLLAAARRCPALLRKAIARRSLTDVSLSDPWVRAFPGWEWSRTLSEAMTYALLRVFPDRQMLEHRKIVAEAHSQPARSSWLVLPQRQRIVRWLVSRPARVETLLPLEAVWRSVSDASVSDAPVSDAPVSDAYDAPVSSR